MSFAVAVKLSGLPEMWREVTGPDRKPLRFDTQTDANVWLDSRYIKLQGVHHRHDVFHGLQPMQVIEVRGET